MSGRRLAVLLLAGLVAAGAEAGTALRFTDATGDSGIDFRTTCGGTPSREILEVDGGGVALFDFDGDSDLDLFVANGATLEKPLEGPGPRLFRNKGDGTFEDVTSAAGIGWRGWSMGLAIGDYDADGRDDVYLAGWGPDALLRNETTREGGPRFRDVTAAAGLGDARWGTSAAFGDVDGDGDLDLYVVNYLEFDPAKPPPRDRQFQGVPVMSGPSGLTPEDDGLYVNDGQGRFRDGTRAAGIVEKTAGYGLGVRIFDFDGDGRQDIFVGNDSTENFLFRNVGGGRFEDVGVRSGVAANHDGATQATMGIALGDVDGNGRPDLFTTNFSHDMNTLHVALDDGFFDDRTSRYGLGLVSRPFLGWGCGFYDFDSDADEDLFVANGHVYPEATAERMGSEYEQPPLVFERGPARFERVEDAGEAVSRAYRGRAAAFGDVDGDGDPDVVLATLNGPIHVLRNDAPRRPVLVVELEQAGPNHRAYGAVVELRTGDVTQRRWITGGGSYQSVDAPAAYFGLGSRAAAPRSLVVRWPDGSVKRLDAPPVDRRLVVRREGEPRIDALRGR